MLPWSCSSSEGFGRGSLFQGGWGVAWAVFLLKHHSLVEWRLKHWMRLLSSVVSCPRAGYEPHSSQVPYHRRDHPSVAAAASSELNLGLPVTEQMGQEQGAPPILLRLPRSVWHGEVSGDCGWVSWRDASEDTGLGSSGVCTPFSMARAAPTHSVLSVLPSCSHPWRCRPPFPAP